MWIFTIAIRQGRRDDLAENVKWPFDRMPKAHIDGLVGPESQNVCEQESAPESVQSADIVVHPKRDSTDLDTGSSR